MELASIVDDLAERASRAGISMAEACRRANMAASTPSRWKAGTVGATLNKINKLRGVIDAAEKARAEHV